MRSLTSSTRTFFALHDQIECEEEAEVQLESTTSKSFADLFAKARGRSDRPLLQAMQLRRVGQYFFLDAAEVIPIGKTTLSQSYRAI